MRVFELIRLTLRVRTMQQALPLLQAALMKSEPGATLMGCWHSEIGPQNVIAILRGFIDVEAREAERIRILTDPDAFGIGVHVIDQHIDDYALFPFLQPLAAGNHGPFYEFREYELVTSGLQPTMVGWHKAVGPRTAKGYSPVYAAFYATTGRVPRYLHIWPYASLEQRMRVRSAAVADGVWPPENSAPQLERMSSTIYLPARFSPLV